MNMNAADVDRFIDGFVITGYAPGGCWEWRTARQGAYGHFGCNGESYAAYRVSHELFNGPIPDGLLVRHRCHNKQCVNPDHLHTGTVSDNIMDSWRSGLRNSHRWAASQKKDSNKVQRIQRTQILREWLIAKHADRWTWTALAEQTNLTSSQITKIVQHKTGIRSGALSDALRLAGLDSAQTPPTAHPVQTGEAK